MKYCLGPWVWDKTAPIVGWRPPVGSSNVVDLRSVPDHAPTGAGFGLFAFDDSAKVGSGYKLLTQAVSLKDAIPKESDRSVFASAIGVQTVDGSTLDEWLFTLLTLYCDHTGDTAAKPLIPGSDRIVRAFGIERPFDINSPNAAKAIATLQEDYRAIRANTLDGKTSDPRLYLKVLGAYAEKYGIDNPEAVFIPADLPVEAAIAPSTTINDDFTRANGALGTATVSGVSQGWSWSSMSGTWQIVSNTAHSIDFSTHNNYRADNDLSSADHYGQVSASQSGGSPWDIGAMSRCASAADTSYIYLVNDAGASVIYSHVSGGYSSIASGSKSTPSATLLKMESNGSTQNGYYGGTLDLTVTDTSITGNLRGGIRSYSNTGILGSFQAADLGGGTSAALTGIAATGSVGTPAPTTTLALTGIAATGSRGTLSPVTSPALTGLAGTGSPGTLAPTFTPALTGSSGTGSVGTLSPSGSATAALTGIAATGAVGSLAPGWSVALTGAAGTGSVGTAVPTRAVALTGPAGTGSVGTLLPAWSVALTGSAGTGSVGTLSPAGDVTRAITGIAATGAAGSLAPLTTLAVTGATGTSALGSLATTTSIALLGSGSTGSVGSVSVFGLVIAVAASPQIWAFTTIDQTSVFTTTAQSVITKDPRLEDITVRGN